MFILPALDIAQTEPDMAPNPDTRNASGAGHFINGEFVETEKFGDFLDR